MLLSGIQPLKKFIAEKFQSDWTFSAQGGKRRKSHRNFLKGISAIESLENRTLLTTLYVTSTADTIDAFFAGKALRDAVSSL